MRYEYEPKRSWTADMTQQCALSAFQRKHLLFQGLPDIREDRSSRSIGEEATVRLEFGHELECYSKADSVASDRRSNEGRRGNWGSYRPDADAGRHRHAGHA